MGNYPGKERHGSAGSTAAFQTPPMSPSSPVSSVFAQPLPSPTHPDHLPCQDRTPSPTKTLTFGRLSSDGIENQKRNARVSLKNAQDGPIIPCQQGQNSTPTSPVRVDLPFSGVAGEGGVEQVLLHECALSLGLCGSDETTHKLSDLLRCFLTEREQMKDELKRMKEKMETERNEWLQFQSDLQVALVVADRLRAEAEEELSALREERVGWEKQLTNSQQSQREVEDQVECLKVELEKSKQRHSQRTETPSQQGATEGCARSIMERRGDERNTAEEKRKEKETSENITKQPASPTSLVNGTSRTSLAPITNPVNNTNSTRERLNTDQQDNLINLYKDLSPNKTSKIKPQEDFSKLLRRHGGSKRNSLLRWSQNRTSGYKNIEITNFSSSWMDGLAFCAVYHSYLPSHIPYSTLRLENKKENLLLAFQTGESVGIAATLTADEMLKTEGPDWQRVLGYVESIYRHFEM
ncbi:cytospin-A isoform X2 [Silurus meridionalis]|uniref:cytospin-A isoform X2 n=1 Tax=Silurus meridionalis TaxID=175797 RepID=UPI001EEC286D|nr:cytospin-A isoform X2 [Silurus meridionalis]